MASPTNFPFGPGQVQDNVTGLSPAQAKSLGQLGTGLPLYDIVIAPMFFTVGAGANGTIEVYVALSEQGGPTGIWTDGINPASGADQSSLILTARRAILINVNPAITTYHSDSFGLYSAFLGFMPMYSCLILFNKTGQPFSANPLNFSLQYSQQNYVSPVPIAYN